MSTGTDLSFQDLSIYPCILKMNDPEPSIFLRESVAAWTICVSSRHGAKGKRSHNKTFRQHHHDEASAAFAIHHDCCAPTEVVTKFTTETQKSTIQINMKIMKFHRLVPSFLQRSTDPWDACIETYRDKAEEQLWVVINALRERGQPAIIITAIHTTMKQQSLKSALHLATYHVGVNFLDDDDMLVIIKEAWKSMENYHGKRATRAWESYERDCGWASCTSRKQTFVQEAEMHVECGIEIKRIHQKRHLLRKQQERQQLLLQGITP